MRPSRRLGFIVGFVVAALVTGVSVLAAQSSQQQIVENSCFTAEDLSSAAREASPAQAYEAALALGRSEIGSITAGTLDGCSLLLVPASPLSESGLGELISSVAPGLRIQRFRAALPGEITTTVTELTVDPNIGLQEAIDDWRSGMIEATAENLSVLRDPETRARLELGFAPSALDGGPEESGQLGLSVSGEVSDIVAMQIDRQIADNERWLGMLRDGSYEVFAVVFSVKSESVVEIDAAMAALRDAGHGALVIDRFGFPAFIKPPNDPARASALAATRER